MADAYTSAEHASHSVTSYDDRSKGAWEAIGYAATAWAFAAVEVASAAKALAENIREIGARLAKAVPGVHPANW